MFLVALTNLLHGVVALVWVVGIRRFGGPLSPTLWADLLRLCLGLPVLVGLLRVAGLPGPPAGWETLRVAKWAEVVSNAGPVAALLLGGLLLGTAALFVIQEAVPAWRYRRHRLHGAWQTDADLSTQADAMVRHLQRTGLAPRRGRLPLARLLDSDKVSAGLVGISAPTLVVSRGLMETLDDEERQAALAHELAHWCRGGNLRLLAVWALRALQAMSPGALLLFRFLVEAEEAACDEVAARVTGKSAALASAILKTHAHPQDEGDTGALAQASNLVLRQAELASTRSRVRQLLDPAQHQPPAPLVPTLAGAGLALLLWSIA